MCVSACESLGDTAADSVIVRCNPMVQYITGSSAVQFFIRIRRAVNVEIHIVSN